MDLPLRCICCQEWLCCLRHISFIMDDPLVIHYVPLVSLHNILICEKFVLYRRCHTIIGSYHTATRLVGLIRIVSPIVHFGKIIYFSYSDLLGIIFYVFLSPFFLFSGNWWLTTNWLIIKRKFFNKDFLFM